MQNDVVFWIGKWVDIGAKFAMGKKIWNTAAVYTFKFETGIDSGFCKLAEIKIAQN